MATPKSINVAVAEQIEKLGSTKVLDTVVSKLADAEITKRADALLSAVKLSEDIQRELRKAEKPDQIAVTMDGGKVETYSAKAFENLKKVKEKLAKIEKVVINATESGDWSKLYEVVKGGGNSEPAKTDDAAANS